MRLSCFSSFRTNSFRSETELNLSGRDPSAASVIRQVARSLEPDFDAPSTQPPKPIRSSKTLISPHLLHTAPVGTADEKRTPDFADMRLKLEALSLAPDEGGNIAANFERDAVSGTLHQQQMLRLFNYTKSQTRISQNSTPWKKTSHWTGAFVEMDLETFHSSEQMKNIVSSCRQSPIISHMQLDSPLAIPAKAAFELHEREINVFGSVSSVISDSSPLAFNDQNKSNIDLSQKCITIKRKKKRSFQMASKWNPLRRPALSRKSRNLKEKIRLEKGKGEIMRFLPHRVRTLFRTRKSLP